MAPQSSRCSRLAKPDGATGVPRSAVTLGCSNVEVLQAGTLGEDARRSIATSYSRCLLVKQRGLCEETMRSKLFVLISLIMLAATLSSAQEKSPSANLALTPPMGWNTWNKFACNVSEELIREAADAMVKSGMKDAGYQYVVIDDCWQVSRDTEGNIQADPQRFPNGMKAVGDYIHSQGLKFGIYSDAGYKTCAGRPASLGHEYQDARQYAAWGVDYLKEDWCNTTTQDAKAAYTLMRKALDASGRPIVLSICEWGGRQPWLWGNEAGGNLWRTTGDIQDRWEGKKEWAPGVCCNYGVVAIVDLQSGIESYAGPEIGRA